MDPLTRAAIERWDAELDAAGGEAERVAELRQWLAEHDLAEGERPLCSVLRPHLVAEADLRHQEQVAGSVVSALRRARDAVVADPDLQRSHLGAFGEWIVRISELDARPAGEGALMRLDSSLARSELHFIELNADMPGGAGHHDEALEFFQRLAPYPKLVDEIGLRPLALEGQMVDTVVDVWGQWGGTGSPTVALVTDPDDLTRRTTVEVDRDRLRGRGLEAELCSLDELGFEGGRLLRDGEPVDLVYRVVGVGECLTDSERARPLLDAATSAAVCVVNPFRSELLGHKALFALITDPERDLGLEPRQRDAVRRHVPWTRVMTEGRTTDPRGSEVDLIEHVASNREHLVLKPTHDFGGHGVELGWRTDDAAWREAIETALGEDFIVQRRVELHREAYPTLDPPGERREFFEDCDPFLFGGRVGGFLTRLSGDEMTNVHVDGSLVASFAVGGR